MAKYVKLGAKAESFTDPYSGLSLGGKEVVVLTPKMENSVKVKAAFNGGHIVIASEHEYNVFIGKEEIPPEETIESKFGSTAAEVIKYYTDTYEVSAKDLKAFKKKSLKDMVQELTELEEKE